MTEKEQIREYLEKLAPLKGNLSENVQNLLYFIVYMGGFASYAQIRKWASSRRISEHVLNGLVGTLNFKGFIEASSYGFASYGYSVGRHLYFNMAFRLLKFHRELCQEYQNLRIFKDKDISWHWDVAESIFDGNSVSWKMAFSPLDSPMKYFAPVCFLRVFWPGIYKLAGHEFHRAVEMFMGRILEEDACTDERLDDIEQLVLGFKPAVGEEPLKKDLLDMTALWRFIATGKEPLHRTSSGATVWSLAGEAIKALYRRDMDACLEFFSASLKLRNKANKDKNLYYESVLSYLLVLAYKIADTEDTRKKTDQFLRKKPVSEYYSLFPAGTLAKYVNAACDERMMESDIRAIATIGSGLYTSYAMLLSKYFQLDAGKIWNNPEGFTLPGCALLRYELSPYFQVEDCAVLEEKFGGRPLLASIVIKPGWEYLLEDLTDRFAKDSGVRPGVEQDKRIVYLVTKPGYVEILLQSRLKSGKWSLGRRIEPYRLNVADFPFMDDFDRKVAANLGYAISPSYQEILPYLAGCDRVFSMRCTPEDAVTVTEEPPYLSVKKTDAGYVLGSNAAVNGNIRGISVIRKTDRLHYAVVNLSDKQASLMSPLLLKGSFPANAGPALMTFLDKIRGIIEVRSDFGGPDMADVQVMESQSAVIFRLSPRKDVFMADIIVRPLQGGQSVFLPGKGDRLVYDMADGRRCQVTRNLKTERDRYREVLYFLENEENISPDEDGRCVFDMAQMLSLLEFVMENQDKYSIEWPDGKPVRFGGVLTSRRFSINVTSGENWLEMEGEAGLDDGTSVKLARLLAGISAGVLSDRYVRLGEDDYVALSDSLMAQLRRLEAVSHVSSKDDVRISSLQVGLLADLLHKSGFSSVSMDSRTAELEASMKEAMQMDISIPSALDASLRDYQEDGFRWMVRLDHWGAGACLADDMGLGKTVQTIAFLLYKAAAGPSLVVAPTSVLLNWAAEIGRFAPSLTVKNINASADRAALVQSAVQSDVFLVSYRMLASEKDLLSGVGWNVVCLDEAHVIKNRETVTSEAVMSLTASSRIVLTGTPVQNYLGELWNLFQFLNPGLLGTYRQFSSRFIDVPANETQMRRQQLKRIISPFLLRRTKADVVEELPEKTEITYRIPLTSDERMQYEVMREKARHQAESADRLNMNVLASITRLRQASCDMALTDSSWKAMSSKTEAFLDLAGEILSGNNRILVFSQFTTYLSTVARELGKKGVEYFYLDGKVPAAKRSEMVAAFQQGEKHVFLISLKAGGLGLNLTGANYVIHLDPWWNPAIEQQATDRAYRIGQSQNVTVYHLISENTIEDKILRLHKTKRDLSDAILEGQDTGHGITLEELREMLAD